MKKIIVSLFVITCVSFSQKFGVSMGTGTYAGIDNYSPKHLIGHYYLSFNEKFTLGFSVGFGSAQFKEEIDYADPADNDESTEVSITGIPLEAELLYFQSIPNSSIKPYIGLGLGFYSYKRNEENDNFDSEASTFGVGQYVTFGLDMNISEKLSMFVQFRKLGFSMVKITNDIKRNNPINDEEITYDYLAQPGIDDLGISAGVKFDF
ncbi:MAG: outer membrane beta-barrel protein [Candidatus Delongbacteria bacterium]|nr:outer membrane beta-barrel protein [Candidatus Delongbacteria bacterium]